LRCCFLTTEYSEEIEYVLVFLCTARRLRRAQNAFLIYGDFIKNERRSVPYEDCSPENELRKS